MFSSPAYLAPVVAAQDPTEDEEAEAVDEDVVDDVTAEDEDDEAEVEDDDNAELVSDYIGLRNEHRTVYPLVVIVIVSVDYFI